MTRAGLVVVLCFAGCRDDGQAAAPEPFAPRPTPVLAPIADDLSTPPPPEPDLPPAPMPLLSGTQAEQAIVADVATPAPPPAGAHVWEITPTRLGRVRLGASRGELVLALADVPKARQRWVRIPQAGARAGPLTPPSLEVAEVFDARGIRMLRFRLLGGRVALAASGYADPEIVTEAGIGIGATLEAAVEAHGDPRPAGVSVAGERVSGLILEDLPGVVLQVTPPVGAKPQAIVGLVVVGPEAD